MLSKQDVMRWEQETSNKEGIVTALRAEIGVLKGAVADKEAHWKLSEESVAREISKSASVCKNVTSLTDKVESLEASLMEAQGKGSGASEALRVMQREIDVMKEAVTVANREIKSLESSVEQKEVEIQNRVVSYEALRKEHDEAWN